MTDSERRRMQLLQKTRMLYSDKKSIPAVHPRYQSVYDELYGPQDEEMSRYGNSTFGIRVFICILLFALFVIADYQEIEYAKVDSTKIVHEIERKIDFDLSL